MQPDLVQSRTHKAAFDPFMRGYHIMYRLNEHNHCPGCGHSHWIIGRLLAECAFCGTALPLECHAGGLGGQPRFAPGHMSQVTV